MCGGFLLETTGLINMLELQAVSQGHRSEMWEFGSEGTAFLLLLWIWSMKTNCVEMNNFNFEGYTTEITFILFIYLLNGQNECLTRPWYSGRSGCTILPRWGSREPRCRGGSAIMSPLECERNLHVNARRFPRQHQECLRSSSLTGNKLKFDTDLHVLNLSVDCCDPSRFLMWSLRN